MHAYSQFGSNEVFLCKCYIEANEKSTALDKDSKQQHLYTSGHTFMLILMMLIVHMEQKVV